MPPLVRILVGSETGNSKEVAKEVALDLAGYKTLLGCTCASLPKLEIEIIDIDDFFLLDRPGNMSGTAIASLFLVSTTGDGEQPFTMRKTWKELIRKSFNLEIDENSGLFFSVFGMGDSTYEKFNFVAKLLYNRLLQLKAVPIAYRGLGDESDENITSTTDYRVEKSETDQDSACKDLDVRRSGFDVELVPWLHQVRKSLVTILKAQSGKYLEPPCVPINLPSMRRYDWRITDGVGEEALYEPQRKCLTVSTTFVKRAMMKENTRITSIEHFQDARHIDISVLCESEQAQILADTLNPGDLFGFFPRNKISEVTKILKYLTFPIDILEKASSTTIAFHNGSEDQIRSHITEIFMGYEGDIMEEVKNLELRDMKTLLMASQIELLIHENSFDTPEGCNIHEKSYTENDSNEIGLRTSFNEADYINVWKSLLDLLIFFFDLVKPPRRCLLKQIHYSMIDKFNDKKTEFKYTIPETLNINDRQAPQPASLIDSHPIFTDVLEKMEEFTSCSDSFEYENYFAKERRSISEFLSEFESIIANESGVSTSLSLSFEDLLSYCPAVFPRMYSLSNPFPIYVKTHPDSPISEISGLSITASIASFTTPHGRLLMGHASELLTSVHVPTYLPRAFFRSGKATAQFLCRNEPLILCATGVGIGVCRSIYLSRKNMDNHWEDVILYGCRHTDKDFLYKNDILQHVSERYSTDHMDLSIVEPKDIFRKVKHTVAFSRHSTGYKIYIQTLISNPANLISVPDRNTKIAMGQYLAELIYEKNASILVCGSAKSLPHELRQAFRKILMAYCPDLKDESLASRYIAMMSLHGRFIMDTW